MDEYLITVISAAVTGLFGLFIGWRLQARRYQKLVSQLELESGDQSLKLLETRKHLRTISGHLKSNLTKDQTIHQLRRKQKSLLKRIDQQTLQARRTEKAHYIETAKIKLELIEARLEQDKTSNQPSAPEPVFKTDLHTELAMDLGQLTGELSKHAGIRKVKQLASLSRHNIDRLASQQESASAE